MHYAQSVVRNHKLYNGDIKKIGDKFQGFVADLPHIRLELRTCE